MIVDGAIRDFLDMARSGLMEDAFHGLRELGVPALVTLEAACRYERDPSVRAVIVRAIRESGSSSSLRFLAEALRESVSSVWKEALDGLVSLNSAESLDALRWALAVERNPVRRQWIEEALQQVARNQRETLSMPNDPLDEYPA